MSEEPRKIDLYEEYRETGFDGKYEHTTRYRLIVDETNRTVILEVEAETQTYPSPPQRKSLTRYEVKAGDLVALIQKHAKPVPAT